MLKLNENLRFSFKTESNICDKYIIMSKSHLGETFELYIYYTMLIQSSHKAFKWFVSYK